LAGEDRFGVDNQLGDDDQFWKRAAQAVVQKEREQNVRQVERLQWSLMRLKLDTADTSARLKYQKKLRAELDARLDPAVDAVVAAL